MSEVESRRELRRSHHHDLSRSQLLDAAEEVFGTKGYHDATLREVAERAEFSVGSVYSFFENKDDLFRHVFLRRGESFLDGVREIVDAEGAPLDAVGRLVTFQVEWFRAHPHFARLYLRSAGPGRLLPGGADGGGIDTFTDVLALERTLIAAGQADGSIRAVVPDALIAVLGGMVTAFLSVDGRVPAATLTTMVVAALRAE